MNDHTLNTYFKGKYMVVFLIPPPLMASILVSPTPCSLMLKQIGAVSMLTVIRAVYGDTADAL